MATQLAAERTEAVAIMTALQTQGNGGKGGEGDGMKHDLDEQVKRYEAAVESAWSDVQRAKRQAEETEARFDRAREFARRTAVEKEEMENTLLDVASDLENLARNYRQHGSPAMAVPLYVSALAIFEKTLGPEHPQVASNLVNLGNAFCDQQKHIEAVPVYLRALAIDEKALGHDHPEVAMDLSNLGIAYRALGRPDIATGLFERAHKLMLAAVGPDDPKTQAILRNLG
jgi:tetratricopeptide (TPR) repeat protein